MSTAKPLKTFWFSRLRNFRFRGFQCYQGLAADFVSRFSSRRFPVVRRKSSRSFLYRTIHVTFQVFWKTNSIMSPSGLETSAEPTRKNRVERLSPPLAARPGAGHPAAPSVIIPRTLALDERVEPVHDETESAALIFGRSQFLPRALWVARIRTRVSICLSRQLPRGADVRPLRPQFIPKAAVGAEFSFQLRAPSIPGCVSLVSDAEERARDGL